MNRNNSNVNTNIMQICFDIATLLLAVLVVSFFTVAQVDKSRIAVVAVFIIIYIMANKEARLYNITLFFYIDRFFKIITKSWFMSSVIVGMILFMFHVRNDSRKWYLTYIVISYILLSINTVLSWLMRRMGNNYKAPRAAFVGKFEDYQKFNYFMNKTSIKLDTIGYILRKGEVSDGMFNVLGEIDAIEDIVRSHEVDQVYFIQKNNQTFKEIQNYIDICFEMGVTVKVILDSQLKKRASSFVSSVGTYPMVTYHSITLNSTEQLLKRVLDILLSTIGIVITSPVMLLTIIAVRIDSPGNAIFKQVRVGQNGRNFNMYKFRSMYQDAEEKKKELLDKNEMQNGPFFKIKNDPRVTKVGRFIRRTSIDELPQLFNVLQGTMSLVGTRPPTLDEVQKYKRSQWRRISIKPGITGLWQVSGRNDIKDFDEVVELDLKYIDNWSLFLDIKIFLQTIVVLIKRDGAY